MKLQGPFLKYQEFGNANIGVLNQALGHFK